MNILKEWQRMCRAMSNEDDVCSYDCPIWGYCPITCESIESIAEIDIKDIILDSKNIERIIYLDYSIDLKGINYVTILKESKV